MSKNWSIDKLKNSTNDSCPLFSFENLKTYAKAIDIYDGDTFDIIISFYDQLYHFKCRMYGYDSPEMKPSKSIPNREEIKKKAILAKTTLWSLLNGPNVEIGDKHSNIFPIVCHEFDKYGRLLVSAFPKDFDLETIDVTKRDLWFSQTLNNQMVQLGLGYPYYGGTKQL